MVRLMGALLLMGGGLWLGLRAAGELGARLWALDSWANALALMEGELAFSLPDLPQLLERLSRGVSGPAGEALEALLQSLERLGESSLEELWDGMLTRQGGALTEADRELLRPLAGVLGRCGWREQREAAERTRRRLEQESALLRKEMGVRGRTYGVLGLALGAFVTILLL